MEFLGIQFAPIYVPLERRLQTLAAAAWFIVLAFGSFAGWLTTIYFLFFTEWMRYIVIVYLAWVYFDRDTCNQGGRGPGATSWLRNSKWWVYYRDYFPIKLVKTADLEPTRNYLLCSYPHGILATGAFGSFATNALNFHKIFPGLDPRIVTLTQHFITPLFREFSYSFGSIGSKAESIEYLLNYKKKSEDDLNKAVVLIVGGAAEALKCKPSTYKILLNKRKGFIRIALKTGTPLVPVFSFGETDLYDQIGGSEDSLLHKTQQFFRQVLGIIPVLVIGRGFFQYTFGLVPKRKPVTVVVGTPMEIPKILEPTTDEINKYHAQFKDKLTELFETYKHKYIKNADKINLEIL